MMQFPLTGGIDQHTDPRKVQPSRLVSATNVQMLKLGKLSKRYGTVAIPVATTDGGTLPPVFALAKRADEPLAMGRNTLHAYSSAKSVWRKRDDLPEYTVQQRTIGQVENLSTGGGVSTIDAAYSSDGALACYAWVSDFTIVGTPNLSLTVAIVDTATGAVVHGPTTLSSPNPAWPRILRVNNSFVVLWADGVNVLKGARLNTSGAVSGWSWTTATLRNDLYFWLFEASADGSNFTVFWAVNGGGANCLSLAKWSETFGVVATNLGIVTASATMPSVVSMTLVAGTRGWIAWHKGAAENLVYFATFDTVGLGLIVGATAVVAEASGPGLMTIGDIGSNKAILCWGMYTGVQQKMRQAVVDYGGTFSATWDEYGKQFYSRPVTVSGRTYVVAKPYDDQLLANSDPLQGTLLLCELTRAVDQSTTGLSMRPVCTWSPRIANYLDFGHMRSLWADASGNLRTIGVIAEQNAVVGTDVVQGIQLCDLAFSYDQGNRQHAQLGGLTYLTGGVPSWYDGRRVGEDVFLQWPSVALSPAAVLNPNPHTTGGLSDNVTYQYAFVYCQRDSAGNLHRGAPYIRSVDTGNSGGLGWKVAWRIQFDGNTTRQDAALNTQRPYIEVYRTLGNGTLFYLLPASTGADFGVTATSTGSWANDPTNPSLDFTDIYTDGLIDEQPTLYTTGGILENVCPPSATLACVHRGRLFLGGTPDGKTIWASKKQIPYEAPGFHESLTIVVDDGGDVTAINSLDDKLVVFKSDRIFVITGEGPDDRGLNSDWSDPIRLNGTVGAVNPHTVVTPMGIVFRSKLGLSLLTRDLQVQPFWSSPVETSLASNVLAGAFVHPTLPEVRFQLSNSTYVQGLELRYDFRHEAWFTADYWNFYPTNDGIRSACVMGDVPWYATAAGLIMAEDQTVYTDNAGFVPATVRFAPVATAGTEGYQSYKSTIVLGDRYTDHTLYVRFFYDDSTTPDERTVTSATHAAWATYQFEASTAGAAKYERIQLEIKDGAGGTLGTGQGFAISDVSFVVAPMEGPVKRLAASQRF